MTEFDLGKVVGTDGRGIQSVELVSTVGKEKTYRITYTDEDYYEFTVKDGDDALNDIVTAWEQTLSDDKVPSEKLTKNTLDTKVDKVTGKGLSAEDYTTVEKTKLAGIEDGANKITVDDDLSSTSMNPLTNRRTYRWLTMKADKNSLATVATTGDYDDLTDKPTISSLGGDVTVEKQSSAESGYFATYHVKQGGTKVGASINIPKDFLVKSASIKTCTQDDVPVQGYVVGDKYFDFVINTKDGSATDEHLYVLVTDLIDTYTADEVTLTVVNNEFKVKNGGISSTQLSTGVNTSLGYADAYHNSPASTITSTDVTNWNGKIDTADIVDDLTTADPTKPLSAKQGKILKDLIDSLMPTVDNVVLTSDKSVLSAYDSESATLTATVTNSQSAPVEDVTVTFYKGSTVLGTATTNNSGVATLTYSATGAGDVTVTAGADSITSNNLSIEDCIRYDNVSIDKSSSYTSVQIDNRGVIQSFSFDTDHYVLSSVSEYFTGWKLADNMDNVEIQCDFKFPGANAYYQALLGYFNNTTSYCLRARGDKLVEEFIWNYDTSSTATTFYTHNIGFTDKYYSLKLRRVGNTATVSIYDGNTELATHNITITADNNAKLFFGFLSYQNRTVLVRNLKTKKI